MKFKTNILKIIMLERNLKLSRLVELTGVSKATISAVRNGKSCSYLTAAKIAKALGMKVEELIDESEV